MVYIYKKETKNNKTILKINCNKTEFQRLNFQHQNVHLFHDYNRKPAFTYSTSQLNSSIYFKIPFGWTLNRTQKKVNKTKQARLQRIDLKDKVLFIYTVQKSHDQHCK